MNIKKISISLFLIGITFSISQAQNVFPNNGNVGVGTMNPNSKLEVNGKTELKGQLRVDSSAVFADSLKVLQKLTADKELVVEGDAFIKGKLELGDNATFKKDVNVYGEVNIDQFKSPSNGNGSGSNNLRYVMVDNDGRLIKGITFNNGGGSSGNGGGAPWIPQPPGCSSIYNELGTFLPWMYDTDNHKVFTCGDNGSYHIGIGLNNSFEVIQLNNYGFVVGSKAYFNDLVDFGNRALFSDNVDIDGDLTVLGNINANFNINDFKHSSGAEFQFRNSTSNDPYFFIGVDRNNDNYVDIGGYDNGGGNFIPLILNRAGNAGVGIGTTCIPTNTMLAVEGNIAAREVTVDADNWCDYVFEDDYDLRSLEDLQKYIDKEGHLPEVPTTAEVEEKGIKLGEMNEILLKKVEELTLYVLQQQKEIEELKNNR